MDFSAYKGSGKLDAPTGQRLSQINVNYNNAGAQALAQAQGGLGAAFVKGGMAYIDFRNKRDNAKVMEANSEYNRLMSEGMGELLKNKEERALNTVDEFDTLHRKTVEGLRKKYGKFLQRGEWANAFNVYTEKDYISRRESAVKHEMNQTEAFEDTQYQNQLAVAGQLAIDAGGDVAALKMAEGRILAITNDRYFQTYGTARVVSEQRKAMQGLIGLGVKTAIDLGDYEKLDKIVQEYGKYMDKNTRVQAGISQAKRQKEAIDLSEIDNAYSNLGRDASYEDVKNYVQSLYSVGTDMNKHANSLIGRTMPNGPNGCVEAAIEITKDFSSKIKKYAGEVGVASLARRAKEDGLLKPYTDGMTINEGDIIVYKEEGASTDVDNLFDYSGPLLHVMVGDGSGGVYGNSSSANDGEGAIVHRDSPAISGQEIAFIIQSGISEQKRPLSELELKEKADKIYKGITDRRANEVRAEKIQIDNGLLLQLDLMNKGIEDPSQFDSIAYQKATDANGNVNPNILIPLQKQGAHIRKILEEEAKKAAKKGSLAVGDGDDYEAVDMIRSALLNGVAPDEMMAQIVQGNFKNKTSLCNEVRNYVEGKGFFALDFTGMAARAKQEMPEWTKNPAYEMAADAAKGYAYRKSQEWSEANGGRRANQTLIYDWFREGLIMPTIETPGVYWGTNTEEVGLSKGQLLQLGITDWTYNNTRKENVVTLTNGQSYSITSEQRERILAGEPATKVIFDR